MIAHQVAKKYSTALFNIVRSKGLIDLAYDQFEDLDKLIKQDETLIRFLLAPHVLDQHKVALVRNVFAPRLEPLFLEFLLVLVNKHRIGYLHEIIEEFRALVADARGMIVAKVTAAAPITQTERDALIARLKAKTGKLVELEVKVDSSILGGMIVILKDKIVDGSVTHKLSLLREELMKLKVA
jgi:ATP synthase F1 delta subunit